MSEHLAFPAVGITHLIIETLSDDAQVRGSAQAEVIQVRTSPARGDAAPRFTAEGATARLAGEEIGRVTVPAGLAVTVERAPGDLRVEGLDGDVTLEAVGGDLLLEALTGVTRVGQVAGSLRAEAVADLRVAERCEGDLRCEEGGDLSVEAVGGDARVADAGAVSLGRVRGDVWIEKARGAVRLGRADGDVRLGAIGGPAALQTVSGDLRAVGLAGGLAAGQVAGDVSLGGPFDAAQGYSVTADGDILMQLPADADMRLAVRAGGRIRSDVRLTPAANGSPTFTGAAGQGACPVNLVCGGDLRVKQTGAAEAPRRAETFGWGNTEGLGDLGERIRQQVTASLASAGINLTTGEVNLGRGPRAPKPPRAPTPPPPPAPPARPSGKALPDEQLAILKMVESGKISAAQAETLLKAMGM